MPNPVRGEVVILLKLIAAMNGVGVNQLHVVVRRLVFLMAGSVELAKIAVRDVRLTVPDVILLTPVPAELLAEAGINGTTAFVLGGQVPLLHLCHRGFPPRPQYPVVMIAVSLALAPVSVAAIRVLVLRISVPVEFVGEAVVMMVVVMMTGKV